MDCLGSLVYADPCRVANWRDAAMPIGQDGSRIVWMGLLYLHTNGDNGMSDSRSIRGLGDLVQLVTDATGISWLTKRIAKARGKDCGCGKRRDKLNKLVPFRGES